MEDGEGVLPATKSVFFGNAVLFQKQYNTMDAAPIALAPRCRYGTEMGNVWCVGGSPYHIQLR